MVSLRGGDGCPVCLPWNGLRVRIEPVWCGRLQLHPSMFLFERFQLFGIIGTAIVVAGPGLWLIQRRGRTVRGTAVSVERKPLNRGTIVGSLLFGIGWSIAGMCRDLFWSTSGKARCTPWRPWRALWRGRARSGRCTLVFRSCSGFRLSGCSRLPRHRSPASESSRNSKTVLCKGQKSKVKSQMLSTRLTFDL